MRWREITFCLTLVLCSQRVFGQLSDTVAIVIRSVLLEPSVSEKIFVKYDDEGQGVSPLPPGKYAFICPDTTFQKVYRGILNLLPGAQDGYSYKKEFYRDSSRTIYIIGIVNSELFIVFKKIDVGPKTATIMFYTTSRFEQNRFKDRYLCVTGKLHKEKQSWQVEKCEINSIGWTEFIRKKYFGQKD